MAETRVLKAAKGQGQGSPQDSRACAGVWRGGGSCEWAEGVGEGVLRGVCGNMEVEELDARRGGGTEWGCVEVFVDVYGMFTTSGVHDKEQVWVWVQV